MSSRPSVLVVAGESPWPARSGGALRTEALIDSLSAVAQVSVAAPGASASAPDGVHTFDLPTSSISRLRAHACRAPRLGAMSIDARGRDALRAIVSDLEADAVLFAHSYLAAASGPVPSGMRIVDFQNLETERLWSFAATGRLRNRVPAAVEVAKSRRWEPRVARQADLVLAVDATDARRLRAWGAQTLLVPNAFRRPSRALPPSPATGPISFIASMGYRPNREAGETLVEQVWPRVRSRVPEARLLLAGRDAGAVFGWTHGREGIEVVADFDDLRSVVNDSSLVVVPVNRGGGTQLKVTQALGLGRLIVATQYSSRSIPAAVRELCAIADDWRSFADAACALLEDVAERHRRERELLAAKLPDWSAACAPLVEAIRSLAPVRPLGLIA
jgi:polysaccharide biosynthesis protein PslH